jgi:hypothetical protein
MGELPMAVLRTRAASVALAVVLIVGAGPATGWTAAKAGKEEGEYRITYAGQEIGTEKYVLTWSKDSASSSSVLSFRNPAMRSQKIRLESKLAMDANFQPRSYELKTEVDGQKGSIIGKFSPNQAIFEYRGGDKPRRSGLLVGNEYTLLDTNIFHHFIFIAKLYKERGRGKVREFEVVIPQEKESGFLRISELQGETIWVEGKKIRATHLQVDSGSLLIQLWLDRRGILQKISVPLRQIEVLRRN